MSEGGELKSPMSEGGELKSPMSEGGELKFPMSVIYIFIYYSSIRPVVRASTLTWLSIYIYLLLQFTVTK
jgi:hypothetical protein